MKYLLAAIILVHGLIHLMGFAREWQLADIKAMSGETLWELSAAGRRFSGIAWLVCCLVFLSAVVMMLKGNDSWWIGTLTAIVISQWLIILYWKDAKAGTIANIIILIAVIPAYGQWQFDRMVKDEVKELLHKTAAPVLVPEQAIANLPLSVQNWMRQCGVPGHEQVHTVWLKQSGQMRTSAGGAWMPVRAEQYFNVAQPGFIWQVDAHMMRVLRLAGRDKYMHGRGNMLIKAFACVGMVDATGTKTDKGSMLRFLGEMCWFPSAALSNYISWRGIDNTHAEATMTYMGSTVSGIFTFNAAGLPVSFEAKRYLGEGDGAKQEQWYVPFGEWKSFGHTRIPTRGSVIWKLDSGDFDYYRWEIEEICYNADAVAKANAE